MIITTELKAAHTATTSAVEPILIPKDEKSLVLEATSETYKIDLGLILSARNGKKTLQRSFFHGKVDLTTLCFAGVIEGEISLCERGEVLKAWKLTPIVIREHSADFSAHDGFAALVARVEELERKTSVIL